MANLRNKRTKSQQTGSHSHFRSDAIVQAELPVSGKSKGTQTRRDNSCNHSTTISNNMYWLRGHYDDVFKNVTLVQTIDDSSYNAKYPSNEKNVQESQKAVCKPPEDALAIVGERLN